MCYHRHQGTPIGSNGLITEWITGCGCDAPTALHTFGYAGKTPDELRILAERLDAIPYGIRSVIVADIRFSPRSRVPHWSGGSLAKLLSDRYRHLLALGNRNYKGGPVEMVDLEVGIETDY